MPSTPADELPDSTASDRNLMLRVKDILRQQSFVSQRALAVSVEQGVVVVQGRVPTFYQRQIAVARIHRVAGVIRVIDQIEVTQAAGGCPVTECANEEPKPPAKSTEHPKGFLS